MKIVSSKEVYSSRVFHVTEDVARDESGFEIDRAIVRHPGSAVMMAVDSSERVLLVQQYRLPAEGLLWELPAGKLDPGETPIEAAKRELKEETGYTAETWTPMVSYWPSPGFLGEKMNLFLATDLTSGEATPMDDERIVTQWFTPDEMETMIYSGGVQDGKTLTGYLYWKTFLRAARKSK